MIRILNVRYFELKKYLNLIKQLKIAKLIKKKTHLNIAFTWYIKVLIKKSNLFHSLIRNVPIRAIISIYAHTLAKSLYIRTQGEFSLLELFFLPSLGRHLEQTRRYVALLDANPSQIVDKADGELFIARRKEDKRKQALIGLFDQLHIADQIQAYFLLARLGIQLGQVNL